MLKNKKIIASFLIITLTLVLLSGCRANPEKPNPQKNSNNPPEVPEILTEMEDTILETMYTIDSIKGVEETIKEMDKEKEEITEESEVDQKKEEKENAAKESVDINKKIEENSIIIPVLKEEDVEGKMIETDSPPTDADEVWFKIQENIYLIHRQWNVLETNLQEVKVNKTEMEKFETLLEETTTYVDETKVEESLLSFNELLGLLAEFRNEFKDKVPYEVYRLKYHTRKTVLLANMDEFDEALKETEKSKELAKGLKQRVIDKGAEDVMQKLTLSLEDLQHEIESENFHLIQIKSAIVMKNIVLMIPPLESGS